MFKVYSFSKSITFAIHTPMLALNLFIVGALIWGIMPPTQSKTFIDHPTRVSSVSLVTNSIATFYSLTLIFLALFNIMIPAFPRIVISCLVLWPCYLISIITYLRNGCFGLKEIAAGSFGIASRLVARDFSNYAGPIAFTLAEVRSQPSTPQLEARTPSINEAWRTKVARQLAGAASFDLTRRPLFDSGPYKGIKELSGFPSFQDLPWTVEMCVQRWKTVTIIQMLALVFTLLCILLVSAEVILAAKIYQRRRDAELMERNSDQENLKVHSEGVKGLLW